MFTSKDITFVHYQERGPVPGEGAKLSPVGLSKFWTRQVSLCGNPGPLQHKYNSLIPRYSLGQKMGFICSE